MSEGERGRKKHARGGVYGEGSLTFLCSGAARRYSCMTQPVVRAAAGNDGDDAFFFRRGTNVIALFTPTRRFPPPQGRGRTTGFSFPDGFHCPLGVALAPPLLPPAPAGRTAKKYFSPSLLASAAKKDCSFSSFSILVTRSMFVGSVVVAWRV